MHTRDYTFAQKKGACIFDASFAEIDKYADKDHIVIITDEEVFRCHQSKMAGFTVLQVPPGEAHKNQPTIDRIIGQLLEFETDKQACIIGVGGGVVTDMAGFVASIYKRGVRLGLVPTTIMGMADAAIGGKNGINAGLYKNMIGTICQPDFILYDYSFLDTLPVKEWINGFAEVIKHACIRDAVLFSMLERFSLHDVQADRTLVAELVERNVAIKLDIVLEDEFEKADRKLLNFGHTFGHAIENLHQLPHGHAISIGMVAACILSEKMNDLHFADAQRVVKLLAKYHLPVDIETDHRKVFEVLKLDKKRMDDQIHFVLLNKIGHAEAKPVRLDYLEAHIKELL